MALTLKTLDRLDLSSVYDEFYRFYFEESTIEDIDNYKSVLVTCTVGGLKQNKGREGVVSEAFAQQIFPIIDSSDEAYRASIVTATLETEGIPTGDRLARFALSLAKLACGDTLSSSDY